MANQAIFSSDKVFSSKFCYCPSFCQRVTNKAKAHFQDSTL